jgi:hypothetical protein
MGAIIFLRFLTCSDTEDLTGNDKVQLQYNGEFIGEPTVINAGGSIALNVEQAILGQATVSLIEFDHPPTDPHDVLGTRTISESEADTGDRTVTFKGGEFPSRYEYTLHYLVVSV